MKTLQIKNAVWKTILLILGAIGFVIASLFILTNETSDLIIKGVAIIGILFFGAAIPIGIKKLIYAPVEIELNKSHLIIQPDSKKSISLPWKEINGFKVIKIKSTKIITIHVENPRKWMDEEKNIVKKKLMKFNLKNYGTPFNISTTSLAISHSKLIQELELYLNKNKH